MPDKRQVSDAEFITAASGATIEPPKGGETKTQSSSFFEICAKSLGNSQEVRAADSGGPSKIEAKSMLNLAPQLRARIDLRRHSRSGNFCQALSQSYSSPQKELQESAQAQLRASVCLLLAYASTWVRVVYIQGCRRCTEVMMNERTNAQIMHG